MKRASMRSTGTWPPRSAPNSTTSSPDVASSYEYGEPEAAILPGILEAALAGIPVSAAVVDRAAVLFPCGNERDAMAWAAAVHAGLRR